MAGLGPRRVGQRRGPRGSDRAGEGPGPGGPGGEAGRARGAWNEKWRYHGSVGDGRGTATDAKYDLRLGALPEEAGPPGSPRAPRSRADP